MALLSEPDSVASLAVRDGQDPAGLREQRLARRKKIIGVLAKRIFGGRITGLPAFVFVHRHLQGFEITKHSPLSTRATYQMDAAVGHEFRRHWTFIDTLNDNFDAKHS